MTRRGVVQMGVGLLVGGLVVLRSSDFALAQQGGWEMQFHQVNECVEVRVGGPDGPLIQWGDRGRGGRVTWCSEDPRSERRDIRQWVYDEPMIRLYARVTAGSGRPWCQMSTLYGGNVRQDWSFDREQYYDITR